MDRAARGENSFASSVVGRWSTINGIPRHERFSQSINTSPRSTIMISLSKILSSFVVLLIACFGSLAQEAARPERGAALNRNYLASDIENINMQNGNVQLSIPL